MDPKEKAKMLDATLEKFRGNKSFSWPAVHELDFYHDINSDFYQVENMLKQLLADNVIIEKTYGFGYPPRLCLTDKGFAMFADMEHESYTAKLKEKEQQRAYAADAMHYAQWAMWASIIGIAVSIIIAVLQYLNK